MIPDPVPVEHLRALVEMAGGTRRAAALAHVDDRTMRRWIEGAAVVPWSVAYCLTHQLNPTPGQASDAM